MNARRARMLGGSALLMSLLAATSAGPVAAADCTLSALTYVNVGTQITIDGAGFPASSDVAISISLDGSASDAFTLQSDGIGSLQIALTPEDIDIGVTTVRAAAGSACTTSVTYTVLVAGATPPPTPTEEPASGTVGAPTAPSTDRDAAIAGGTSGMGLPWFLALALVGAGAAGLYLTRSPRVR